MLLMRLSISRDRDEQLITLDGTVYAQSIALTEFPRFRKVEAIILPYRIKPLDHASPDKLFTKGAFSNGVCNLKDAYYVAGDNLHISQSQLASSARISYFKYPPILTDDSPTFWLLEVSPWMVINKAASDIFFDIGDETSGRTKKALADEAFTSAKRDYKYSSNYG
jgi:hypothetical protein